MALKYIPIEETLSGDKRKYLRFSLEAESFFRGTFYVQLDEVDKLMKTFEDSGKLPTSFEAYIERGRVFDTETKKDTVRVDKVTKIPILKALAKRMKESLQRDKVPNPYRRELKYLDSMWVTEKRLEEKLGEGEN